MLLARNKIFRIIDANLNRSREGLRVCEDIARFALGSEAETKLLKSVRHNISSIAKRFESELGLLIDYRDPKEDVGRSSRIKVGMTRKSLRDIFAANMERAKESIRVLEEFFKLIDPSVSSRLSRLRFKTYDIEKKIIRKIEPLRYSRRGITATPRDGARSKAGRGRRGRYNPV